MISSKIKSIDVLRKVTRPTKPDAAAKKWQNLSHFQLRQSASLFVPMFLRSGKITLLKISNTLHSQCTAALESTFNRSRCRSLFRPRVGIRLMIYAFGVVIGQIWKILNNIWINISRSLSNEKTKTKDPLIFLLFVSPNKVSTLLSLPNHRPNSTSDPRLKHKRLFGFLLKHQSL